MMKKFVICMLALFFSGGVAVASCSPYPNTLTNGQNADASQVMANFNSIQNCVNTLPSIASVQQSGRLSYISSTLVKFAPLNGDQIKINGALFAIPSGGITGCANTAVFVNGTANQNLAASTLYYVYAFVNSGVVTADFRTGGHATSSTVGNIGTEILSGDDTRSLIGMVRTNGSSQFVDSSAQRFTRSWFNETGTETSNAYTAARSTSSATWVEVNTEIRNEVILWSGERLNLFLAGAAYNSAASNAIWAGLAVDGTTPEPAGSYFNSAGSTFANSLGASNLKTGLAEGYHYITMVAQTSGGTATFVAGSGALVYTTVLTVSNRH